MMFRSREFPSIDDRPSLLAFVRARLDATGRLVDSACTLPDEAPVAAGGIGWMAGALDGIMGHHGGGSAGEVAQASRLAQLIVAAAGRPRRRELTDLYSMASAQDVLSLMWSAFATPRTRLSHVGFW